MNRYVITRTSVWDDDISPCEEAFKFKGSYIHGCTCKSFEEARSLPHVENWFFAKDKRDHRVVEGKLECESDHEFWIIEIESIEEAFKRYGQVIVSRSHCKEIPIEIKIYHGYRE